MADFPICTTSPGVPDWVVAEAGALGARFVTLESSEPGAVAGQLAAVRPAGYLLNWPDLGPYLTGELADAAGALRIVSYLGQSPEPDFYRPYLELDALRERGIVLTTTPDPESPVAECALGLLLALELDLVPANAARKSGTGYPTPTHRAGLVDRGLGIVGMGAIGRRMAGLATACGMRIGYTSRSRHPEVERALGATYRELPALFATADYVSLHVPAGPGTGLIDAGVLSHARGVSLVNTTSLGRVVDPEALLHALDRGWVRKLAMEGRYAEPYDERLRAYGDDRVLLMPPYTSYATPRSERVGWRAYLASLTAVVNGDPVPHQIR